MWVLTKEAHLLLSIYPHCLDHVLTMVYIYGYEFGSLIKLVSFLINNNYFLFPGIMIKYNQNEKENPSYTWHFSLCLLIELVFMS